MSIQAIGGGGVVQGVVGHESPSFASRVSRFFFSWLPLNWVSGSCCSEERIYTLLYDGLATAASVGGVGALALLIKGVPAVAVLMGVLSISTGVGAYLADQVLRQRALGRCLSDLQKTNGDLQKTNADLVNTNTDLQKTNTDLQKTNADLKFERREFSKENRRLKLEVDTMSRQNRAYQKENQSYRRNNQQLEGSLELLKDQTGKYEAQNNEYKRLAMGFKQYLQDLKDQHLIQDQGLAKRLRKLEGSIDASVGVWDQMLKDRKIFCEQHQQQIAALQKAIEKVKDGKLVAAQWKQLQLLGQNNHQMMAHSQALREEIAKREGALIEIEKRLNTLKQELAGLVKDQQTLHKKMKGSHAAFDQKVTQFGKQVVALDLLGKQYFGGPLSSCKRQARGVVSGMNYGVV